MPVRWGEQLYAEDVCDEVWSRLARSVCGRDGISAVSNWESHVRRQPRTGDWRGEHAVAARARGEHVGRHA